MNLTKAQQTYEVAKKSLQAKQAELEAVKKILKDLQDNFDA